jgi:hypothetical protein
VSPKLAARSFWILAHANDLMMPDAVFFEPNLDRRNNLNKNKKVIDMGVAVDILQLSEP